MSGEPNFSQPYLSSTIPEFWRTWHISLSTWLRDYVYTPLRVKLRNWGTAGLFFVLTLTFVIAGIWHGAGWNYIGFGIIHGALVIGSSATLKRRNRLWARLGVPSRLIHILRVVITFVLITLSFVLFRANDLPEAMYMYGRILSADGYTLGMTTSLVPVIILTMITADVLARRGYSLDALPRAVRWGTYYAMLAAVFFLGVTDANFIYFAF